MESDEIVLPDGRKITIDSTDGITFTFEDWDPSDVEEFMQRFEQMVKEEMP